MHAHSMGEGGEERGAFTSKANNVLGGWGEGKGNNTPSLVVSGWRHAWRLGDGGMAWLLFLARR